MDHGTAKHPRAVKQPPVRQAKPTKPNKLPPARVKDLHRLAPPPPSSRRELPAPTPLVLPTHLQTGASPAARAQNEARGRVPSSARRKQAPPPPSSRKAKPVEGNGQLPPLGAKPAPDRARQVDAQWAVHLAGHGDPREPMTAASRGGERPLTNEPPSLPNNLPLLNLEGEISSLRPRPSELPPEPLPEPIGQARYRGKTPSDLSVLYQALPSNYEARGATSPYRAGHDVSRTRGYVPKAPHEYLPPPPPPSKRNTSLKAQAADDDEAPTQTRVPALPPLDAQVQAEPTSVPPAWSPAAIASHVGGSHLGSRSPLPPPVSVFPVASRAGIAPSNNGRLPPPPAVPSGFAVENEWQASEWTDSKRAETFHAASLAAPAGRQSDTPPDFALSAESIHPTAVTIPAPSRARLFPTFGLPPGWAPVAGASLLGAALSAGAFLLPARGQLLVDVTNQGWASLPDADVYINDELVCTQSPCAVKVDTVPHRVRVVAPGYQASAEESVVVTEGVVTLHKVQLGASSDTGIEVRTSIPNLQLYVDGRRIGSLPRKVMGLPPGEHTLIVSGGDQFTTEERRIQLEPNQTLTIDDLQPTLKVGTLELQAGQNSKGARVTLDGNEITLPYKGELQPGRRYLLEANRDGYEPLQRELVLDANTPSLELPVVLTELAGSERGPTSGERPVHSYRSRWQAPAQTRHEVGTSAAQTSETPAVGNVDGETDSALGAAMRQSVGLPTEAPTSTKSAKSGGTLNIVTSPSSLVLLDGRPVGKTPTRVHVGAGQHSVVLIHANGRKRASVNVEPGSDKTIKASF